MKILHVITNTELGGAQTVCIFLANMAACDGSTVAVASMPGGYLWNQLDKRIIRFTIESMVKPLCPYSDIKCYMQLKKHIEQFAPDIIHLHSSKAGALGRLAGRKYKNRIVYTVHGFDSIRLHYKMFLPLERWLQNYCGAIVAVSKYDEKNLRDAGITAHVHTIYNGIKLTGQTMLPPFDASSYKKVIMTIARISAQKRFAFFLQVAGHKDMKDYLFIWIGGAVEKTIDELRQEYTIPPNVLLLGDYPDASALLKYCDLFVLFTNYEGLPMTILEAMAQKKAVVASNVGGIPELIDDSNGILIQTDEAAVPSILSILNDENKSQTMGECSFTKYVHSFTLERMWKNYWKLYNELLTATY